MYIRIAHIWHDTGCFQGLVEERDNFWLPPLLFYAMKNLMSLGISAETAGVGINLVLGTFTPLLTYGIAREIIQRKDIALCAAFLTAINPSMTFFSGKVQRDMVYIFFAGATLWLLAAGVRRQKWPFWLGSGILCGCGILVRFETMEFLFIVPVILGVMCLMKNCQWKKAFGFATLFFLSFFLCVCTLSTIMQTNDYLLTNYTKYFRQKLFVLDSQIRYNSENTTQ